MRNAVSSALFMAAVLAACGPKDSAPERDVAGRAEPPTAVPVELPPSIVATKGYRCADGSVLLVEFYSDRRSASMKVGADGTPKRVEAREAGARMVADGGWSLEGSADGSKASVTSPGRARPLSCHT